MCVVRSEVFPESKCETSDMLNDNTVEISCGGIYVEMPTLYIYHTPVDSIKSVFSC